MLGYRKKSFASAHSMLQRIRANREDLGSLLSLQRLLFREILGTERKIRELKSELKNVAQNNGSSARKRSSLLKNRIEKVRQCAYVWRCFGDAIAFIYLDKFALKQCFYSIEAATVRQDAGFLSDKAGAADEIALVESAIRDKIPAVLADLTNTIRYGDVCLMGASDPLLVEVIPRKKSDDRPHTPKRLTPEQESAQSKAAFAAIRALFCQVTEPWHSCKRGYCRRHHCCIGEIGHCLKRHWPLMTAAAQDKVHSEVIVGGPRRVRPQTHTEWSLRRFPPSNFVHG